MKATAETEGQVIEIDTEGMEKRISESLEAKFKPVMEELKTLKTDNAKKGVVETFDTDKKKAVLEELRKGGAADIQKLKEQWTICVPNFAWACFFAAYCKFS